MRVGPRHLAGSIAAAFLFVGGVQAAAPTGTLRGVVVDRDGNPLPGVTLVLTHAAQAVPEQGTVSNALGEYKFLSLPAVNGYSVKASLASFQTLKFDDLQVYPGTVTVQNITLRPSMTEKVTVAGKSDVVETDSATTSTNISQEFLAGLPILGRDYQDALTLAPGVSDVNNTGNPNIHGARDTDVLTLVDGVNVTDPFTGLYGQELNVESIEEIEVITAGASAEYSRAQGGFVNIITKSGGNEFRGAFRFFIQSYRLDGDGAGIDPGDLRGGVGETDGFRDLKFTNLYPFVSLSGPIVRDKVWYYVAPEFSQIEDPIDVGTQAFVEQTRSVRTTAKLTWQIAPNSKLAFLTLFDDTTQDNQGVESRVPVESGYGFERGGPTITLQHTQLFGATLSLESTLSRFDQSFAVVPQLDADTNGNGLLFRNDYLSGTTPDGFHSAKDRDPGEDYDADGRYDIFEDVIRNGVLDGCFKNPVTGITSCFEDFDGDLRLTGPFGCEGADHEDLDCDGRIDSEIDRNENGRVDPDEDRGIPCAAPLLCPTGVVPGTAGNGTLDSEDRNGNQQLDTVGDSGPTSTPFWDDRNGDGAKDPGEFQAPRPPDRDYTVDLGLNRTSGPFYFDYRDYRTRDSLQEDLSMFVDDFFGTHDLKLGGIVEREGFERDRGQRPYLQLTPIGVNRESGVIYRTIGTLLPTQAAIHNSAESTHFGFFVQDSYKPLPNLSVGLGLRFDREEVGSHGYTFFDPALQRREYDLLMGLKGVESNGDDLNADGILTHPLSADPLYAASNIVLVDPVHAAVTANKLAQAATARLTRHNYVTDVVSRLLPGVGVDDPALLKDGRPRRAEDFTITNNNLAPRLSFSWDPRGDGRTKVAGSWGRFYGNLFLQSVVGEEGPDIVSPYYAYDPDGTDPYGIPNHRIGNLISSPPPSAFQVDRNLRTPFTDEWTLAVTGEIAPEVSLGFTYVTRKFREQLQDVDVNHTTRRAPFCSGPTTPAGYCDDFGITIPPLSQRERYARFPDSYPDLYVNNFNFNQIFRIGNYNYQAYDSYELHLVRRLRRKWQMDASYVFSKATGQAESFLSESGDDPALTELKQGYLEYDQRHVIKFNAVAFLPAEWQLGGSLTWSSGLPYSFVNRFQSNDNVEYVQTRRLFGYRDQNSGYFLSENRNIHRNHSVYDINVRTQKSFVMGQISAGAFFEIYNLLNTDDLRVYEIDNREFTLQADEEREFGRRFQVGIEMNF